MDRATGKLAGQVALLTGAARRVGRALALELAEAGCHVAVHFRESVTEAEQVAAAVKNLGAKAVLIQADLDDPKAWRGVVDQTVSGLGRLDVLVNNASLFLTDQPDTIEGFDLAVWERMLRVNLLAPVGLVHHAAAHLAAHGKGHVINFCDAGIERPWPRHLAYSASKAALANVTKALARALAPAVRVNAVAPGIAVFPENYPTDLRQRLVERVPLAREGTPEDMATTVRFLVESGDYITGQVINVDGGRSIV